MTLDELLEGAAALLGLAIWYGLLVGVAALIWWLVQAL